MALASANQPYLALDDLKLAGPALKNSTKGWICVGHCRAVTDNAEGAQQAFEEALKHDANSPEAWEALADLAMERADYPQAIRRLTWLVEHKPDSHQFSKQLAIAKARLR
ncbi:MAG: tetratricopeptide repeat protein [Verrucomicrobiaceae bacterium]|nr:tetratricopeptide repeat protein [Verrucomicrobiaceae bacterium]